MHTPEELLAGPDRASAERALALLGLPATHITVFDDREDYCELLEVQLPHASHEYHGHEGEDATEFRTYHFHDWVMVVEEDLFGTWKRYWLPADRAP